MSRILDKNYTSESIIIGRRNFLEADRMVDVFTLEKGRISAIVKGARRSASKLAGSTELFIHGTFSFARGKKNDILTGASSIHCFQESHENLQKLSHLFFISEILSRLLPPEVPNKEVFRETVAFLEKTNKNNSPYLTYMYIYRLLILLGYGPSLDICPICHKDSDGSFVFDCESGGILCENCTSKSGYRRNINISKNTFKILKFIGTNDLQKYSRLSFDDPTGNSLFTLVDTYLDSVYQRELKSKKFVTTVEELKQ